MCGILLYVQYSKLWDISYENLKERVAARGPDFAQEIVLQHGPAVRLYSSVLYMREPFTRQPVHTERGVLQYNGELYNKETIDGCDTSFITQHIEDGGLPKSLERFRGEYAFTYTTKDMIWFGRDPIGRRSLQYCFDEEAGLIVTSVGVDDLQFHEVPGGLLMCYDLTSKTMSAFDWTYHAMSKDLPIYPFTPLTVNNKDPVLNDLDAELEQLLLRAVCARTTGGHRAQSVDKATNGCETSTSGARLAILFSGGLDCSLMAMMVDRVLPSFESVDLLNVAFENPRTGGGFQTPDRLLARRSFEELQGISAHPSRFRLVEIDVPFQEMIEYRPIVQSLMRPKDSVMDLSIAIAFYFASRGRGRLILSKDFNGAALPPQEMYVSKARMLLSGLGADELFGGYVRHSAKLRRDGLQGLCNELQLDFDRLHERNLGRDDRVCSCWGKEVRYPFLDEHVVSWAMARCPLTLKVFQSKDGTTEEKHILRLIARRSGLKLVASEKKRAIQFGAKSAKMEPGQGKVKGDDYLQILPKGTLDQLVKRLLMRI